MGWRQVDGCKRKEAERGLLLPWLTPEHVSAHLVGSHYYLNY